MSANEPKPKRTRVKRGTRTNYAEKWHKLEFYLETMIRVTGKGDKTPEARATLAAYQDAYDYMHPGGTDATTAP